MKTKPDLSMPNDELLIHVYLMGARMLDRRGLPAIGYIGDEKWIHQLLARLLRSDRPIRRIRLDLAALFDPDATQADRHLVFAYRKPGRRRHPDLYGFTIAEFILKQVNSGSKREAIFAVAQKKFNLNRSTILKAWKEYKHLAEAALLMEAEGQPSVSGSDQKKE
jgi:hypothetical protein